MTEHNPPAADARPADGAAQSPNGAARDPAALGADLVLPGLALAFTIYFFHSVRGLVWEAKATAIIVGVTLLVLVAAQIGRVALQVAAGKANLSIRPLVEPRRTQMVRLALIALTGLFILVIPWLGVTLGLFVLTGALMVLLGAGSWRRILLTAGIVSAAAYLLFIALLESRLPHGPVEKLLGLLF